MRAKKRILLVARHYSIEPLGILYLAGLVREHADWECKVLLVREFDFEPLYAAARTWRPDIVGFQIWTGYHLQAFAACDRVRSMGIPVAIGGPHATYFHSECEKHAEWVIRAGGFGLLRKLLQGGLPAGTHFDTHGREGAFPRPDRDLVYDAYPELGNSPIKSIFASVGCPFTCTYCYAPSFNEMHGGFDLNVRSVDDLIAEARAIQARWPLRMVYFQDDIFGYNSRWLKEFAARWRSEVGVPFHCQIRLELARHDSGSRRLDLFAQAGCSGITLAIESGNAFLRDRVLLRHMPDALIEEGCRKVMDRSMTLRTEQILAVPFSDICTDLATLSLNNRIDPTMAWTSILAPYAGTDMGTIVSNFGLYDGNNDDLTESFFDRSVLRHIEGGPRDIERIVQELGVPPSAPPPLQPLLKLRAQKNGSDTAPVLSDGKPVGTIEYLSARENDRYSADTVRLQRLFNFLAKVPDAESLARSLLSLSDNEWGWEEIGKTTTSHLGDRCGSAKLGDNAQALAQEMGQPSAEELPEVVRRNLQYFCYFPAGGELARKVADADLFGTELSTAQSLDALNTMTRRHLFHYGLYRIDAGAEPIAS